MMSDDNRYEGYDGYEQEQSTTRTRSSRQKTKKSRRKKKTSGEKIKIPVKKIVIIAMIAAFICFVIGCIMVYSIISKTPEIDPENFYSLLSENSTIYDMNGQKVEDLKSEGLRTNIPYSEMPKDLRNAFISIEDKTFWTHHGFNFTRLAGAVIESLRRGEGASGTSTITQQLARNLYLDLDRNWTRKIKEAYYTVEIEKKLSKEQILEAYLNTINLGSGAWGVQAASQAYFGKDVGELTIAECAVLASMPQSPSRYAAVKRYNTEDVDAGIPEEDILEQGEVYTLVYNDAFKSRQEMTLRLMNEFGYITDEQYEEALAQDIRESLNPSIDTSSGISSYFSDYVVRQVRQNLMDALNIEEEQASEMIFNGGLSIYSTIDINIQRIAEKEFENNANFPTGTNAKKDSAGNIIDSSKRVMLYKYDNMFDKEGSFVIPKEDYTLKESGDLVLHAGKRLNFYKTKTSEGSTDYTIEFKKIYVVEDNIFYSYNGGTVLFPVSYAKHKKLDDDRNLVINSEFFKENPDLFLFESDGTIRIANNHYILRQKVVQPQGAVVVIDQRSGEIRTMVGGRNIEGRMLYNRATNPNPPGSSIKPIAVYAPALAMGLTAATVVDDCETVIGGKVWPSNYNHVFQGLVSMRKAVQDSINVAAVKFQEQVGVDGSVDMLKKLGVTTLVESGAINDMNPSALALGGMTNGIPPLEMAAAYATIANDGEYIEPTCYTTVTDRKGQVILESDPEKHRAMDQDVAYVMTDILKSVVTEGLGGRARLSGSNIPVAGKTGTTSNNYDAWFCGFTPYYSAALWIGNDVDIDMREGSSRAASLWSKIMTQAHKGLSGKTFTAHSSNIINVQIDSISGKLPTDLSRMDPRGTLRTEIFIKGTEPVEMDDFHVLAETCTESKYKSTPYCPSMTTGVYVKRPEGWTGAKAQDMIYNVPEYFCNLHNPDPNAYPISPNASLSNWSPPPDNPETDIDLDGSEEYEDGIEDSSDVQEVVF